MSDTPRTNALRLRFTKGNADLDDSLDLCDTLERELNEAVAKGENITHQLGVAMMQLHESNHALSTFTSKHAL